MCFLDRIPMEKWTPRLQRIARLATAKCGSTGKYRRSQRHKERESDTDTIFLDSSSWDLALDASRNIARATNPYALAQDAASACKTFQGEVYYDTTQGVPYFAEILGQRPPLELLKGDYVRAALTVPEVIAARVFVSGIVQRRLSGQVQVTDSQRVVSVADF